MGRTVWRSGALGILFGLGLARTAQAEELPPMPLLRLTWPVAPLRFSFSGSEEGNYASGPLRLFRAESLWLRAPALQILTVASAERSVELDCSGLTCQPVVKHGLAVEARFALPRFNGAVPSSYAYVRGASYRTPQSLSPRSAGLITAGFGGTLNF